MKSGYGKILGIMVSVTIVLLILWLSITLEDKNKPEIEIIELNGNFHLSKEDYFRFARLDETDSYEFLTLSVIKDRLEKHPYIDVVNVKQETKSKVTVDLVEKEFSTLLFHINQSYLLTQTFEVLPFLPGTKKVDYPVISNLNESLKVKEFVSLETDDELKEAYKILFAIKLLNPGLYDQLSEVDMGAGRGVVLSFINFDYPVLLGRDEHIKRLVYFDTLYGILQKYKNNDLLEYIDLRYNSKVYLGLGQDINRGLDS